MSRIYKKLLARAEQQGKQSDVIHVDLSPKSAHVVKAAAAFAPTLLRLRASDYSKYFALGGPSERMRANWDALGDRMARSFLTVKGQMVADQVAMVEAKLREIKALETLPNVHQGEAAHGHKRSNNDRKRAVSGSTGKARAV